MENQFELLHVGLNSGSPEKAEETAKLFSLMFNLPVKMGNSSDFAGKYFECMKSPSARGTNGHIAMATENVDAAKAELEAKGYTFVPETASYNATYASTPTGGTLCCGRMRSAPMEPVFISPQTVRRYRRNRLLLRNPSPPSRSASGTYRTPHRPSGSPLPEW